MKKIIAYLVLVGLLDIFLLAASRSGIMPPWWSALGLVVVCSLIGGLGGVVYCLRGVYLSASVRKSWDDQWQPWYYIRPIVSHICGAISFLFLKAGLILLEAQPKTHATDLGFMALAFIAGLNVDKFITKIEDIAQATWGIKKSRTASDSSNEDK
jgi:H+/Cl- antiporter ClcA